jgi:hypothetical protein
VKRRKIGIKINIKKSPIPLIWIDTSIIIFMAKVKIGEKIESKLKAKIQYLFDSIIEGRRKKKLLCPRADQAEEFEMGERLEKECKNVQADLSLNIAMKHRLTVEDYYVKTFMKAYVNGTEEIDLSYKCLFHHDPIIELDEKIKEKFIITVKFSTPKEILEAWKKSSEKARLMYEDLRKDNVLKKVGFEQQLERERTGTHDGLIIKAKNFLEKLKNNQPIEYSEILGINNILYYLKLWEQYTGKRKDFQGLFEFFLSEYHYQIPKIEIELSLFAKLLTGTTPIKPGDSMDIQQLSSVLPFFDLVITDKTRKSDIEYLGYHEKYGVQVMALKNFDIIKDFFTKQLCV